MRCLTLANELKAHGWRCSFACTDETLSFIPALLKSAHATIGIDQTSDDVDILIVDHYGLDQDYEATCRPWVKRIVVIDDLANRPHDCDILIDQTFGRHEDDYKSLVPSHCNILTGPSYALLRPQFAQARSAALTRRQERDGKIDRVLIMMGASDPDNVASLALAGVNLVKDTLAIDIIMGARAPHLKNVKQKAQKSHHEVTIHAGVDNVASLMADADICIGAGGTTSWERCCLGLPSVVIEIADNQQKIIHELSRAGAIYAGGHFSELSPEKLYDILSEFLHEPDRLVKMSHAAADVCDGSGVKRFIPYVYPAIQAKEGGNICVRCMDMVDANIVLKWQSFPKTRKYFRNPKAPSQSEHHQWMVRSVNSSVNEVYIVQYNNIPAGLLQLKCKEDQVYEVSILIAPDYYGRGIATSALAWARILKPQAIFVAEILDQNEASKSLFTKAGYIPKGNNLYVCKNEEGT